MFYEKYEDTRGEWRWRLKAANGKIIANSGEGYHNSGDCSHAIDLVKACKRLGLPFEIYTDAKKQWRWRLKAKNGQIIAVSGEGYFNRADCIHAIELVKSSSTAPVKELV